MTENNFSREEILQWISIQASFGARRAGSLAGELNENFLMEKLSEFGLSNVRKEKIPVLYSEAQCWDLSIGERKIDSYPIPYCAFTTASSKYQMAFADYRDPFAGSEKWKNKIVVTEIHFPEINIKLLKKISLGSYDPDNNIENASHPATWIRLGWHIYQQAAKYGAAGFVGILVDQTGGSCEMYAPYGFKEKNFLHKPIPGFWAKKRDKDFLLHAAKNEEMACIMINGIQRPSVTYNIIGEIPGTGQTDEEIILGSHHDSPFVSPVEDASGVAVTLAIAKYFSKNPSLKRTLKVIFSAGHFYGSIGTRTYIANLSSEQLKRIALEIHIEHIALEAVENSSGTLVATSLAEPAGIFVPLNKKIIKLVRDNLEKHDLRRSILLPPEGPLGDYPPTDGGDWYQAGIPVINFISNPVYLLTNDDDIKWVNNDYLLKTSQTFTEIIKSVDTLSKSEISQKDFFVYSLLMKILKLIQKCKTTLFGLRPIH